MKKNSINFFSSLKFQTIALNIVMYAMLIFTWLIVVNGVTTMSDTAVIISSSGMTVIREIGEAEMLVETIYADAAITAVASEIADESVLMFQSNYQNYKKKAIADLDSVISRYSDPSIDGMEKSREQALKVKETVNSFFIDVDQIYEGKISGDTSLMHNAAQKMREDLAQIENECKSMNDLLDKTIENIEPMIQKVRKGVAAQIIAIFVIMGLIILLNATLTLTRINLKISSISKELQDMIKKLREGRGDLTARIGTKSNTELNYIKTGINEFIESLQIVLREVKDGTVILGDSSSVVVEKVQRANDSVTNTSAALEELSASMESVSTTVGSINERLVEVKSAADDIENEAQSGAMKAKEIQLEAVQIKKDAGDKKNTTGAKVIELSEVLTQSVKDSEKVSEIETLTDEILSIASQTNLLALNASIEAARAGDAGKGFAVVAQEITQLASNSKATAENIRAISQAVTESVKSLSDNATSVIDFINTNVLADYDSFVETGEKYENTAEIIDEMTGRFKEKSDNLNHIMNEMANGVNSITNSVKESSSAIAMSAENSTEIVSEIQDITEAINENNRVTDRLTESAAKFEFM